MGEQRRLPVGAEPQPEGGVHFRVWAPRCKKVAMVIEGEPDGIELTAEGSGYFSGTCSQAHAGTRYRYRLDECQTLFADPASRYQPEGPFGSSCVVDPTFEWSDEAWGGLTLQGQVLYEMHVGTFTREGTWKSGIEQLARLSELGITTVEIMPVAEFPGKFGWGYDGVNLFAPSRLYGEPDDFRRFVDSAHSLGLGVILDVVYNHLGPEGNCITEFSVDFYTDRYKNEWGDPINFDGSNSRPVREYFIANAEYWIAEFHLDGLRIDATQTMFDSSPRHILACITESARKAAGKKRILLIAENEPQQVKCLKPPEQGGYGMDAVWNDDFHHSSHVAVTGCSEAYFSEYCGNPQELVSAVKWGYLYQGQHYYWQLRRRGTPTAGFTSASFINYLQNHDQVANSANGSRIHQQTSPGSFRAITALLLLAPGTPMLFQGQEFAASTPFLYFMDLGPDVAMLVRKGRAGFLEQFPNIASHEVVLDNPADPATFERCRLHPEDGQFNSQVYAMHRDLLRLRKEDPVFRAASSARIEGAVLGPEAFLIRYFAPEGQRLLLVNLGRDLHLRPAPEPLLAPPEESGWSLLWSSESVSYGGSGTPNLENECFWRVPGRTAVVLNPTAKERPYD